MEKPDLGADGPAARARPSYVATHRGQVMARSVASEPLDHWHQQGIITPRQYEAGQRLRMAYDKATLTRSSMIASPSYVSSDSDLDDGRPDETEDQRYARQVIFSKIWTAAREHLGSSWLIVRVSICDGQFPAHSGAYRHVQAALEKLADLWKIPA